MWNWGPFKFPPGNNKIQSQRYWQRKCCIKWDVKVRCLAAYFWNVEGRSKVVIINPTVDVGNEDKLGFLPGDLMEKIEVHNESSIFILNKI